MAQLDDFRRALYSRSGSDGSDGHAPKRSLLEASNIHAISLIRGAWSKINHRHARTVLLKSRRIDVQNGLGLGLPRRPHSSAPGRYNQLLSLSWQNAGCAFRVNKDIDHLAVF